MLTFLWWVAVLIFSSPVLAAFFYKKQLEKAVEQKGDDLTKAEATTMAVGTGALFYNIIKLICMIFFAPFFIILYAVGLIKK